MHQSSTPSQDSTHAQLAEQLGLQQADALIVVDMQRDFMPGGNLAVPDGDRIVPAVNAYLAAFAARELPIFLTRDWHPPGHCSFQQSGGPWPPHCVRDTAGADWAIGMHVPDGAHIVSKATDVGKDAYSGFDGTSLAEDLRARKVQRVFVAGVATDYCVRATVLDARKNGFDVIVLTDAIRGIDREAGDESRALQEMTESGAMLFERGRSPCTHGGSPLQAAPQ